MELLERRVRPEAIEQRPSELQHGLRHLDPVAHPREVHETEMPVQGKGVHRLAT
jgi:hypothetical protein